MNKILVTGGSGFIGSNLCEFLLSDSDNYVICLELRRVKKILIIYFKF